MFFVGVGVLVLVSVCVCVCVWFWGRGVVCFSSSSSSSSSRGAICSSVIECPLFERWVVRSIPHGGPIELLLVPASVP